MRQGSPLREQPRLSCHPRDWAGALPRGARHGRRPPPAVSTAARFGRAGPWAKRCTCLRRRSPFRGNSQWSEGISRACPGPYAALRGRLGRRGIAGRCGGAGPSGAQTRREEPAARGSGSRRHRGAWLWAGLRSDPPSLSLPNNAVLRGNSPDRTT